VEASLLAALFVGEPEHLVRAHLTGRHEPDPRAVITVVLPEPAPATTTYGDAAR
jgi:hypothetical protein